MKNIMKFHEVKVGQMFTVAKEQGRPTTAKGRFIKQGESHSTEYRGTKDIILAGDDIVYIVRNNSQQAAHPLAKRASTSLTH